MDNAKHSIHVLNQPLTYTFTESVRSKGIWNDYESDKNTAMCLCSLFWNYFNAIPMKQATTCG
jgi:hypothetical protein